MKTLLATLNAKFVHSSLSVRCLKKFCSEFDIILKEYTINDNTDAVISGIYEENADVIAFSCYIWNVEKVFYICECLKKAKPEIIIVLGGLEVSYDSYDIMKQYNFIDFIISGEGEIPFKSLLSELEGERNYKNVPSLTYRENGEIFQTKKLAAQDLNAYPFVYDNADELKNKIVYYESSRGCPYNCSYCLSGEGNAVSFLDVFRVKKELKFFIDNNIPLVKFVDRTFNADRKRAEDIFLYIIDNCKNTKFHFELAGDLITDSTLEILKKAKKDIMQFEIGVQSTNEKTIAAIGRKIDFNKLKGRILSLLSLGTIHIHLDLIAGLPYEDLQSFKKSFDDVIALKPHMLQLGFLKLLKGSRIRNEAEKYGYVFKSKAPYEIISNDFMSFGDICYLKKIEQVLDKYYNSGEFEKSINYLFDKFESRFEIFDRIAAHFEKNHLFEIGLSPDMLCDVLIDVFCEFDDFADYVNFDRMTNAKCKKKNNFEKNPHFKEACFEFLKDEKNIQKYLCDFKDFSAKKLVKFIRIERFFDKIWLFNLKNNEYSEISEDFDKFYVETP